MTETNYADRINALLAKAASSTHEAEREVFTEKAERLMVKWGIDDAMLTDAAKADKQRQRVAIEERRYTVEGPNGALLAELVASVAARGVGPIRTLISRGGRDWWAIGYTDDLARVELYVPHLVDEARLAWKQHLAEAVYNHDTLRNRARIAFLSSFGWAVKQRLDALFVEVTTTAGGTGELVLANRSREVERELYRRNPLSRSVAARRTRDWSARLAGWSAGEAASLAAGALE